MKLLRASAFLIGYYLLLVFVVATLGCSKSQSAPSTASAESQPAAEVDLGFSSDSGRSWQNIVSNYANTSTYSWTVPAIASTKCLIRIRSSEDSTINDTSDSVFTILGNSLHLVLDTVVTRYFGTAMPLEWTQRGIEKVVLNYKTSKNGNWQLIKDAAPATTQIYNWVLPTLYSDSLWIKISDSNDPLTKDEQLFAGVFKTLPLATATKYLGGSFDGHAFRSTNNKISIFKPAANDTLSSGSSFPISWVAGNVTDSVTLQYSVDSGTSWKNIVTTAAASGQYIWTVPTASAGKSFKLAASRSSSNILDRCIVRAVVGNTTDEVVGISRATFSIDQSGSLPPAYYWVGGAGLWSDYSHHWATTSGGTTFHLQPPSSVNNVFFDANSFTATGQSVTVDIISASCNNMDWTGVVNKPDLIVPSSNKITVYGSLTK